MKRYGMMVLAVMAVAMAWAEMSIRPLTFQETAKYGATDAIVIRASDLDVSTANVAQTNTFTLTGPVAWEFTGFLLDSPFDTSQVTNAMTCALSVSVGSDTVLNAIQIANDAWKPYKAYWPTVPTVTTSGWATNQMTSTVTAPYKGIVTNGATATITVVVGAPGAAHTLNKTDSGQARAFFRLLR